MTFLFILEAAKIASVSTIRATLSTYSLTDVPSILVNFKYSIYASNGDNDDNGDYDGDDDDNDDYDGDDGDEEEDHWTKGLVGWDMVAPPTLVSHKTGNAKRIENHRHQLKITTTS